MTGRKLNGCHMFYSVETKQGLPVAASRQHTTETDKLFSPVKLLELLINHFQLCIFQSSLLDFADEAGGCARRAGVLVKIRAALLLFRGAWLFYKNHTRTNL